MKHYFVNTRLIAIMLVALLLSSPVYVYGQDLSKANIEKVLNDAYNKFKDVKEGANADYIKELATVDPNIFGISIVTTDGQVFTVGDIKSEVSIQSISKAFIMSKVIEEQGHQAVQDKIGVDATGEPFNSALIVEKQKGKEINPLVNPGAIASTSLLAGADSAAKFKNVVQTLSDFAGRELKINMPVYISEASDNMHNQALAKLLLSFGRMYFDPEEATDIYTKQCAMNINAKDLAVMGATLANGGFNPVTKKKVVSPETAMYTLPVMATAGLYDDSGIWYYNTGVPAKSGVGGGIVAVVPGKFGIGVVSPPLDKAGNSVKAQYVIKYVIEQLKVNPFLVQPKQ
jgi:glutaminase